MTPATVTAVVIVAGGWVALLLHDALARGRKVLDQRHWLERALREETVAVKNQQAIEASNMRTIAAKRDARLEELRAQAQHEERIARAFIEDDGDDWKRGVR